MVSAITSNALTRWHCHDKRFYLVTYFYTLELRSDTKKWNSQRNGICSRVISSHTGHSVLCRGNERTSRLLCFYQAIDNWINSSVNVWICYKPIALLPWFNEEDNTPKKMIVWFEHKSYENTKFTVCLNKVSYARIMPTVRLIQAYVSIEHAFASIKLAVGLIKAYYN